MKYQVTIIFDLEAPDLATARGFAEEVQYVAVIDCDAVDSGTFRYDVAPHPRKAGGRVAGLEAAAETIGPLGGVTDVRSQKQEMTVEEFEEVEGISFIDVLEEQAPQIQHPWDQGLWIFPPDHPLRHIEEEAKRQARSVPDKEPLKQFFLDAGRKALPPGSEPSE